MDANDDPLEPFREATASTLRDMAGVEMVAMKTYKAVADQSPGELKAVIRLFADPEGCLMLSLPERTAETLARKILEVGEVEPRSDLVRDCMGEVVNVIAGQAKALTFGTPRHFTLGTPVVGTGPAATPDGDRWVIEFVGEGFGFQLHVWLPGNGGMTP